MADDTRQVVEEPIQRQQPQQATGARDVVEEPIQRPAAAPASDEIPKNYGFTLGNMAHNAKEGIYQFGNSIKGVAHDLVDNPNWVNSDTGRGTMKGYIAMPAVEKPGESTLDKTVTIPMEQQADKAGQDWAKPGIGPKISAAGHLLAASIPLVGPWAADLGEQAGTGDVGGALARGGTQVVAAKYGPSMVKGGLKGVTSPVLDVIADKVADRIAKPGTGAAPVTPQATLAKTAPIASPATEGARPVTLKDVGAVVDKTLGNEPLKPGVAIKDQFKPEVKAAEQKFSSRPDKAVLQKAGASEADMSKLLNLSNVDLRQLAINAGEDMKQEQIGRGKSSGLTPREAIFERLLKNHSAAELVKLTKQPK
jgi:hypothetical protein